MADPNPAKLASARAAVALVEKGMRLGLGTGSTAVIMVDELAARNKAENLELTCVATSKATGEQATRLGLRVVSLDDAGWLDLTIDGADEVDPELRLIKGGGAAHLREKIVASASDRMVVIADEGKIVDQLGAFPLPIEVIQMGWSVTAKLIKAVMDDLGLSGEITRRQKDGWPVLTDEGNFVLDLHLGVIPDPEALALRLEAIAGIVEHGLFLGLADLVLVGKDDGTAREMRA